MSLSIKRIIIAVLAVAFLVSLLFVQWREIIRAKQHAGLAEPTIAVPDESRGCVDCHLQETPGIIEHWTNSTHAETGVACLDCHQAEKGDADAYKHEGSLIALIVTPRDCGRCHQDEFTQFTASHHSKAGNILDSLDNFLAETVEGGRSKAGEVVSVRFNPHSPTPGMADVKDVNGMAAAMTGCLQCHGSKLALQTTDGGMITVDDLQPDPETGLPTNPDVLKQVARGKEDKPLFHTGTWPNTGIGRLNLDGSRGSCTACHSRHDFSPRRARQPENCGKCHLGPDHPQKEIYEESKHGIAYRDLKDDMNLDATTWILGKDYAAAPTCATCHLSANSRDEHVTHDPGQRISWTNRPPISLVTDTDETGKVIYYDPPEERKEIVDTAMDKRSRMKDVCSHCHTPDYVDGFYKQYDDFVVLYNEKFAKPGKAIMGELKSQGLLTATPFDEPIEWTWFYLWHHEGRRARHGASMMAPDYAHWHGTYEVAERFYDAMIPEAREIVEKARADGKTDEAQAVEELIESILERPEHAWFEKAKEKKEAEVEPEVQPEPDLLKEVAEETIEEVTADPVEGDKEPVLAE